VDKSYLKLTSSISKDYKFNARNSVSFRLWGGYFIQNTQRNSSNYADRFTRASLALAHQGFNDYAYDEYFHTRQDQSSRLIQQTSMAGGGFKTAVGNIQRVMMSNDFALALNVVTDIPIKILVDLEIKLFGDIGYYKSKSFESEDLQGNYVYSTGLSMHIADGLQIHLPLINSKIINDRYSDLDRGLFERISFTFDINHFRFWQTATSNVK
jgi:hypothetical protein